MRVTPIYFPSLCEAATRLLLRLHFTSSLRVSAFWIIRAGLAVVKTGARKHPPHEDEAESATSTSHLLIYKALFTPVGHIKTPSNEQIIISRKNTTCIQSTRRSPPRSGGGEVRTTRLFNPIPITDSIHYLRHDGEIHRRVSTRDGVQPTRRCSFT